jgi:chitodextrinase
VAPQLTRVQVPGDYASIQAAHDAATSGDTILLQPGVYVEQIIITKAITLASLYVTTGDESYIAATVLDGGNRPYTISIPSDAEDRPTIQGVTIRNSDDGITPRAMFNLLNSVITGTNDGIDYEDGSGGLVQFSTFELNGDDGIDLDFSVDVVIRDNVIRNNDDDGIEIRLQDHTGTTLNIVMTQNRIHGNGEDGIQLIGYDVPTDRFFEISRNTIYDNVDAGIGMMDGATSTEDFRAASLPERINIVGNTFANNRYGITGGDNTVVLNNIFVGHPAIAVKNVDGSSELAYNLFYGNGIDNSGSNGDAGSSVFADPLLDANLELLAGSPAIDAGTAHYVWQTETVLDLAPDAYAGSAPDMGAFEYGIGTGPPPSAPVLVSPANGTTEVGLMPTLSWTGAGDIFRVQIATESAFSNIVEEAVVATPSHTVAVGALNHGTTYHWRVDASDTNGTSEYSAVWSFATAAASGPPDAPVLVSPADGAADVPLEAVLVWAGTADHFDVEVGTDAAFQVVVFSTNTELSTITLPPGTLEHETLYYWRVRGTNNVFGSGEPSVARSFTTVPPPDTEAPTQPQNLGSPAQTTTTVDLVWAASTDNVGVTGYNIYRDGGYVANESSPNHTATGLTAATSYDFQVSAVDAAGNESDLSGVLTVATLETDPLPTLHVGRIDLQLQSTGRWSTGRAVIGIVDGSGAPVSGATVVAQWSGLASDLDSGTTSSGEVQFDSDRVDGKLPGELVITVTDVNASGYVYDPSANVVAVGCIDSAGNSCTVEPPDTDPPDAPIGLTATAGPGSVSLDWDDNTETDLASYSVHRSLTSGGSYALVVDGLTVSQYTNSGLSGGTTYYYVVTAEDVSGNESDPSPEASATPTEPPQLSVHVADITVAIARQGRNYFAQATVSVVDQDGQPVSGVLVAGDWTWNGAAIGAASATTDTDGVVTLESSKEKANSGGVFVFTVTDLVLDGYIYNPANNVKTSESASVP